MNFKEFVKSASLNESKKTEFFHEIEEMKADTTGLAVNVIFGPKEQEGKFFRDDERYWFDADFYFDFVSEDDGDVGNKWVEIESNKVTVESIQFTLDKPDSLSDDEEKEWKELEDRSKTFHEKFKDGKNIVKELFNDIDKHFVDNYKRIMDKAKDDHDDRY